MELLLFSLSLIVMFHISITLYSYVFKPKTIPEKNIQLPPGSTGWPFIGESMEYLSLARRGCIDKFTSDRNKKYNSKLFKTSLLGENMVILCSAEGNKLLFSSENKFVRSWWPRNFDKIFANSGKTTTPEEAMRMRKLSTIFSKPEALQEYVGIIDTVAKQHLSMNWDCKEEVMVHSLARKFTFALSCRLMLNIQDPKSVEELGKLFDPIAAGFLSLPINIPGTKLNRAIRASKEIRIKFEAMIKQRKIEVMEKKNSESKDVLSLLLLEKYRDGEEMNETDIANKMLGLLVAAYDNPSVTIVSIIKYLAELPEVYEEFLKEQMEIANSKRPEELLNFGDIKKMKYSWNVAREVLRLQPPGPGSFREVITNFNYDGFLIPKGWKVHWFAYATHKNPECFPDPEKFDPLRFEGNRLVPFSYVPFGGGPHMCPGKEYARLQILVFMHSLVKKFRWKKVFPDEQMIGDPLLFPSKGLPIRLSPNNPN